MGDDSAMQLVQLQCDITDSQALEAKLGEIEEVFLCNSLQL